MGRIQSSSPAEPDKKTMAVFVFRVVPSLLFTDSVEKFYLYLSNIIEIFMYPTL